MKELSYIYILANERRTVLYIGVTNNLKKRVWEHRQKQEKSFTGRYNVSRLVYFEHYESIEIAIQREKQLKGGSRKKKIDLIIKNNPEWSDLYTELS